MLQRQRQNFFHWPDRWLPRLDIDAGGVHARRVLDTRVGQERAGAASADACMA